MRPFGVLLVGVAIASLTGCDPVFAEQYRQALYPAPGQECMGDALRASRVVTGAVPVAKKESGFARAPGFRVTLPDSTAPGGVVHELFVTRAALPDSVPGARIAVTYHFMGGGPGTDERRRLEALANQILAEVRAACASATAPTAVECKRLDFLNRKGAGCRAR